MAVYSLQMRYIIAKASEKLPALSRLLRSLQPTPIKTIVYLSTCAAVDYMQHILPAIINTNDGPHFGVVTLHGKHQPNVRQKNFSRFSNSTAPTVLLTTDVAARGLDIPQVDLVVQIDPPNDPKVFLHRCGRAGRAGRSGLSVVMLLRGREEDYIHLLEVRMTPTTPLLDPEIAIARDEEASASAKIRQVVLRDRAIHDKAQRAFVSWVQAYSKHQASSIFRASDLDWTDVGNAWGLLKLPRMPELKRWTGDRSLGLKVDFNNYTYQDRQRESKRKAGIRDAGESQGTSVSWDSRRRKTGQSWSQNTDIREERERRREKRKAKKEIERLENMSTDERKKDVELQALISEVKRTREHDEGLEEFNGFAE